MGLRPAVLMAMIVLAVGACGSGGTGVATGGGTAGGTNPPSTSPTDTGTPSSPDSTSGSSLGSSSVSPSAPEAPSAPTTATTGPVTTAETPATLPLAGGGTVAVQLEEIGGVFIEGFEIGLRFERADGTVIASTLWTEFVASLGEQSIEAYYDSVLEQPVPAGPVVVWASANVGAGPGPEIPDVGGDLRCRLELDVPPGGTVRVEVGFTDPDRCLTLVSGG